VSDCRIGERARHTISYFNMLSIPPLAALPVSPLVIRHV
jgi:hypothetical protein